jgi:hypothetical protein
MLHVVVKSFSLPKMKNYYFDMMFIPSTGSQTVGDADPLGTISHDLHHAPLLSRLTHWFVFLLQLAPNVRTCLGNPVSLPTLFDCFSNPNVKGG